MKSVSHNDRQSLYAEVTNRVIAELEQGHVPWVCPWDRAASDCGMPGNASTDRAYSGINILILWAAVIEGGYASQRWLTYKQAQAAGGTVRKGEKGVTVCYADRFTPQDERERAQSEDRDARQVAFLKRFTVFNVDQCDGLGEGIAPAAVVQRDFDPVPRAEALIAASGADFRTGGSEAYYAPEQDLIMVPPRQAFREPINWYRTALHELGHNAASRIMPNGDLQSTNLVGFFSPAIGIIPISSTARSMGSLRSGVSKPHRKSLLFRVLKSAPFGMRSVGIKIPAQSARLRYEDYAERQAAGTLETVLFRPFIRHNPGCGIMAIMPISA